MCGWQVPSMMSGRVLHLLRSGASMTVIGSGGYVAYTDYQRYPRMIKAYSAGNILPPYKENNHETTYFPRPDIERRLQSILSSTFSNSYYTIMGVVGSGKSRSIIEAVRGLRRTNGHRNQVRYHRVVVKHECKFM